MSKQFLIYSLLIVLISCRDDSTKDILSKEQMTAIQWDMMRADELVEYYHASDSLFKPDQKRVAYYAKIFSIHHTTKEAFTRSLNYYTSNPPLLKEIMDSIEARGQKQAAADSVKPVIDSAVLKKDSNVHALIDSLKRKNLLKKNKR